MLPTGWWSQPPAPPHSRWCCKDRCTCLEEQREELTGRQRWSISEWSYYLILSLQDKLEVLRHSKGQTIWTDDPHTGTSGKHAGLLGKL